MHSPLRPKPGWLKDLFPWNQHSLIVNGRRTGYIDEGQGRPALLLSGNPTWGFLYRDFIAPLTDAGYRAIAPDWIGAGYSDHPRQDSALTLAHHIADLVSLLDQLDLRGLFPHAAPTVLIPGAGHFIQEDAGEEVALAIRAWVERD